jgi:hypothetical protein
VKLSWRTRRPPSQWRGRRPVLRWPLSPCQQGTGKPASRQSRNSSGPSSHLFYRDHVKFHFAIAPLTSPFTARRTALTRPLSSPDLDGSCRSLPWRLVGAGGQADRGPAVPGGPGGDLAAVEPGDLLGELPVVWRSKPSWLADCLAISALHQSAAFSVSTPVRARAVGIAAFRTGPVSFVRASENAPTASGSRRRRAALAAGGDDGRLVAPPRRPASRAATSAASAAERRGREDQRRFPERSGDFACQRHDPPQRVGQAGRLGRDPPAHRVPACPEPAGALLAWEPRTAEG